MIRPQRTSQRRQSCQEPEEGQLFCSFLVVVLCLSFNNQLFEALPPLLPIQPRSCEAKSNKKAQPRGCSAGWPGLKR